MHETPTPHKPRVLVGIGNPERERRLLAGLAADKFVVAGRCLDAPSLVEQAVEVDAVLASADLHRLSADALIAVREAGVPLVLLVDPSDVARYNGHAYLLPSGSGQPEVVAALAQAIERGAVSDDKRPIEAAAGGARESCDGRGRGVIALVSGKGAPGATTMAMGLASAFAAMGRRVLLVDADLRGGAICPFLDLDPRRGLVGLTVGTRAGEVASLDDELQAAGSFHVLAGIERPEIRDRLVPEQAAAAIRELEPSFESVVVDLGETLAGVASHVTNAVLRMADEVLVVTTADLAGLWNARSCLRYLQESGGITTDRVDVVINRHVGRGHYAAPEVQRALGVRVLGTIPEDRRAARVAVSEQVPLTTVGGAAARELRAVANALTSSETTAAADRRLAQKPQRSRWRRSPVEARR
ncbi:P-loop NTPase [bacterium]|nr:P-loop NTPase [bacterium]